MSTIAAIGITIDNLAIPALAAGAAIILVVRHWLQRSGKDQGDD